MIRGVPPLGGKGVADHLVGRSTTTEPQGSLVWTLRVSDQLVEAMGDEWSRPVQFRFKIEDDGRLDMWMRNVEEGSVT